MSRLDPEAVMDRLTTVLPGAITAMGFKRDTCVLHTRTAVAVFRELGFQVQPRSVAVLAMNEAFYARVAEGKVPSKETEREWIDSGAWSVNIGRMPWEDRQHNPGRFDGHLVTAVEGRWLFDPTLDQASRPQKGINLEPGWFPAADLLGGDAESIAAEVGEPTSYVLYSLLEGADSRWLNARDWTQPPRDPSWKRLVGKLTAGLLDDLG